MYINIPECNICKKNNNIYFTQYKGKLFNVKELRLCNNCKVVFAHPVPTEKQLSNFYKKGHYFKSVSKQDNKLVTISQSIINTSRINFLSKEINFNLVSKILDIGAGSANFGRELKKKFKNINYDIVEPDEKIFKKNELFIRNSFNDIKKINTEQYDLIIINFVMEHLLNPVDFLKQIKFLLKNKGFIYIEIPNSEYNYKDLYTPHIFFWNLISFNYIISLLKFKTIYIDTFGMDYKIASNYFKTKKNYLRYFNFKIYFNKLYSIILPNKFIKNSLLINNLYNSGGARNWIKVLIYKHE